MGVGGGGGEGDIICGLSWANKEKHEICLKGLAEGRN